MIYMIFRDDGVSSLKEDFLCKPVRSKTPDRHVAYGAA